MATLESALTIGGPGPAGAEEDDHAGGLTQRAYVALRHAIRELRLPPGHTLVEQEVAAALGVSRTPVREALARLQADGLVEGGARSGLQVMRLSADDLQETFEIVEGLEGMAVALAAERSAPAALAELEHLIDRQEAALVRVDEERLPEWARLDHEFHDALVALSGNRRLRRLIETYGDQLHRARLFTIKLRPLPTRSNAEHRAVAAAVRAGDSQGARALLQAHRHRARDQILRVVRALSL